MGKHWTTALAPLILATAAVFTGCATIRQSQVRDTEQLLAAAGFTRQVTDTAHQQQHDALPPYRLVRRTRDGVLEYAYADPESCTCVYVGGSTEYAAYQRLATDRRMAREDAWEDRDFFASPWRPWW